MKTKTADYRNGFYGRRFDCPGCRQPHVVPVTGPNARCFNGNDDAPTFTPSVDIHFANGARCHSFITDGRIAFLGDCSHGLAGQTVELPDVDTY